MKKIYIILLLLIIALVSADKYYVTTVPTCDGKIHIKVPEDFTVLDCARDVINDQYLCPCAVNQKIYIDGKIKEAKKVKVEYFLEKYKKDEYRITS